MTKIQEMRQRVRYEEAHAERRERDADLLLSPIPIESLREEHCSPDWWNKRMAEQKRQSALARRHRDNARRIRMNIRRLEAVKSGV